MKVRYNVGKHLKKTCEAYSQTTSTVFLFFLTLLVGAFVCAQWMPVVPSHDMLTTIHSHTALPESVSANPRKPDPPSLPILLPISCSNTTNQTRHRIKYPAPPTLLPSSLPPPSSTCPSYFRWIHEDLRPWAKTGITLDMVERAKKTANFRLTIVNGRAYVQKYQRAFQTRDVFTVWGILQLLRYYPGKIPDLDLMFDCVDWPVVKADEYNWENAPSPPPLFRYCGDESTLDIVFPDWSFWGWAEINIKPWEALKREIDGGNKRVGWMNREPYAYWKGNPAVAKIRQELVQCNVSETHDWNARIYAQNWLKESQEGFKDSDLSKQCIHRYKIYIEGSAWSVSEKYILACDSMTLIVKPKYYDFYSRGLMPVQHYWPIRENDKCRSIKFAVDWGNSHKQKAQEIGKQASSYVQEMLKMENIYDYMFHLLTEYAKLLKYKPTVPPNATEICSESMACRAHGVEQKFMLDSVVHKPSDVGPCELPPPFSDVELKTIQTRRENSIKQVETWEENAWKTETG
ncbi:O-glucosyltransferase rumi-like protein (DUF821) [Rhynchospora pubera]|uniref:O-glucosyltransferase rumi-like protein (DUF821) n=1 Tax=Rhynchospora pubera TaxID=906938 RepID=A0AAV8BUL4_9POAL|nr:O-glucosyltransferase rumi-like protein (DUF821) [Rhynchospora pubera]